MISRNYFTEENRNKPGTVEEGKFFFIKHFDFTDSSIFAITFIGTQFKNTGILFAEQSFSEYHRKQSLVKWYNGYIHSYLLGIAL